MIIKAQFQKIHNFKVLNKIIRLRMMFQIMKTYWKREISMISHRPSRLFLLFRSKIGPKTKDKTHSKIIDKLKTNPKS